jgi:ABC-2 type transport system ATP-binding protein
MLSLTNVTKRYTSRTALSEISLEVEAGSTVGLLGPNGAGKTTILRLLLGFTQPTSGSVLVRGLEPSDPESRRGLGYLPERMILPERMTVRGLLHLHADLAGIDRGDHVRQADEAMEQVGIADRAKDGIGTLSKGLRQRVGFAQAFLGKPAILLLDEPTSGLDPIGMRDAREWIAALRKRGATVLVSSHVLSEVERVCDKVAILNEGHVVASGSLPELVGDSETLEDAFVRLVQK